MKTRRKVNPGWKQGVPRHRVMCKRSANQLEKAIETVTRREGKREAQDY